MPIVLAFLLPCLKKICFLEVKLFSNFMGASDAGKIQTSHRHPGFYIPAQPLKAEQGYKSPDDGAKFESCQHHLLP